jgi:hypothetical protein
MYSQFYFPLCFAFALLAFAGCIGQPTEPVELVSYVSFLDQGAVVPDPVSTLVVIDPLTISFRSSQQGVTLTKWINSIDRQDYGHLLSIIEGNRLVGAPDPPSVSPLCVGVRALIVVISTHDVLDTISIAGVARCDTTSWPRGLGSLVRFKDSLVGKYSP